MSRKRIAINLLANFISFFITLSISFFLTPFIVKTIGAEAYGFITLGNNLVEYISLITIALNSMAGRFVSIKIYENDFDGANIIFNSVIFANLIIASILIIPLSIFVIFIDKFFHIPLSLLNDIRILFGFIFLGFLLSLITSLFGVSLFIKNKLYLNSIRGIEAAVLRLILLIFLFTIFPPKIFFISLVGLTIQIYYIFWNIHYTIKLTPELHLKRRYIKIDAIKELVSSGSWNVVSKLSEILNTGLDLLITNIFLGPTLMGALAIAKTIPNILYSILYLITGVFTPDMTKHYAGRDYKKVKDVLEQSMKLVAILINIPLAGFIVFGDIFYNLWVPSQNAKEIYILSIITVGVMILSGTSISIYNVFTVTNKIKANSLVNLGTGILNAVIVIILLKTTNLGIYAVAGVSTILGLIRVIFFTLPYGANCLNQKWYALFKPTIRTVVSLVILICIMFIIKININIDSWSELILTSLISAVIGLSFNVFLVLSKSERMELINVINKRNNK